MDFGIMVFMYCVRGKGRRGGGGGGGGGGGIDLLCCENWI